MKLRLKNLISLSVMLVSLFAVNVNAELRQWKLNSSSNLDLGDVRFSEKNKEVVFNITKQSQSANTIKFTWNNGFDGSCTHPVGDIVHGTYAGCAIYEWIKDTETICIDTSNAPDFKELDLNIDVMISKEKPRSRKYQVSLFTEDAFFEFVPKTTLRCLGADRSFVVIETND